MSDGPHRSLPMRPPWKRVAHWADKEAFSVEDVRASVEVATEQDCREIRSEFLADIRRVAEEPTLFPDDAAGRLAALQPQAGPDLSGRCWIASRFSPRRSRQVWRRCKRPSNRRRAIARVAGHDCGVCAACMLRRMSVHAAGLTEPGERYVWMDLAAPAFTAGAAQSYRDKGKITQAAREYAIAGALHLDHLADLSTTGAVAPELAATQLAGALGMTPADAQEKLGELLLQHRSEWEAFMRSLGPDSFVADWARAGRA